MLVQSIENQRIFPPFFRMPVVKTVRLQINAIQFIFIEADIRTFKSESQREVSATRIGDPLSYDFPLTELC